MKQSHMDNSKRFSIASLSDFQLRRVVCEVRYEDAFLLFDRTGAIFHSLKQSFTNLKVTNATPTSSTFESKEGTIVVEIGQSRLVSDRVTDFEKFGEACRKFFSDITSHLEITSFTRVGLRLVYFLPLPLELPASSAVGQLKLLALSTEKERFKASATPTEVLMRWQGQSTGTMIRLAGEMGVLDIELPPEVETEKRAVRKDVNSVILDVDHYTVAPVLVGQWNPLFWIPSAAHLIKKECNNIFEEIS